MLIAQDARHRAASADALGSLEDLASLSAQMSSTMFAVQAERARAALHEGVSREGQREAQARLETQMRLTDTERARLKRLLDGRDLSKLPVRISHDLVATRDALDSLPAFRDRVVAGRATMDDILAFYGGSTRR